MRRLLVSIMAVVTLTTAAHASTPTRTSTTYRSKDGATITIVGRGCFSQEDVTKLKLVAYESPTELTYRCITP